MNDCVNDRHWAQVCLQKKDHITSQHHGLFAIWLVLRKKAFVDLLLKMSYHLIEIPQKNTKRHTHGQSVGDIKTENGEDTYMLF